MSDDSNEKTSPMHPEAPKKTADSAWNQIQQELRGALDTWTDLTEKSRDAKDPEEEKLRDMRRLLADLQAKMKDFEG